MRITLNPSHLKLWGKWAYYFVLYFILALIVGPHARPDELLFVLTLPLWVLVPYIVFCFVVALIRSWSIRRHSGRGRVEVGFMPHEGIEKRCRTPHHRASDHVPRV